MSIEKMETERQCRSTLRGKNQACGAQNDKDDRKGENMK